MVTPMIQVIIHRYRSVSRRAGRLGLLSLITILCAACDFNLGPASDEGRLTKIGLYGESQVQVGDTIRLSAEGSVSGIVGLLFYDRILDGRFSASDTTIATILPFIPPPSDSTSVASVLVEGRKVGTVQIKVSARGITGTHRVDVIADTTPN
jgi:hypothetical protein